MDFHSRRSPVLSQYGMVSSSQPLVSQVGQKILKLGGNAADACIAMNMALAVVEPCSTGLGGDCFALYYQKSDETVYGLNGSGRSPNGLTIDVINNYLKNNQKNNNIKNKILPAAHALNVTVPGNVSGTIDFHNKFGTLSRDILFEPAINLAENGFILSTVTSYLWNKGKNKLVGNNDKYNFDNRHMYSYGKDLLNKNNEAPPIGTLFKNKKIANVLKYIARDGKSAFYDTRHSSKIGQNIIDVIRLNGGIMTSDDLLNNHHSTFVEPICINYKNKVKIYEIPPNGQGIAALMALNFYQNKNDQKNTKNDKNEKNGGKFQPIFKNTKTFSDINDRIEELHHKIECMRLSFRYSRQLICDLSISPNNNNIGNNLYKFISPEFGKKCFNSEIFCDKINKETLLNGGYPIDSSDTVSFAAIDKYGNGCSFISSNYEGFGSGLVPYNCGFTLQNRGYNFKRNINEKDHCNFIGPNKRPYHTIIPGMATYADTNELYAAFNVMGGFMQPQGHFQVISNMIDYGMNPQESLDCPRFCIDVSSDEGQLDINKNESIVCMEPMGKYNDKIVKGLESKGHKIKILNGFERQLFGRGQIIFNDRNNGNLLWGGSDGRADGCAIGLETDQEMTYVVDKNAMKSKL